MQVKDLISQIENIDYYPISEPHWNILLIRGTVDKFDLIKDDVLISELKLDEHFRASMMRYRDSCLNIISHFDEELYSQYKADYLKIDDFDLGKIYIIKLKK